VATLEWSAAARQQLTDLLLWLDANRSSVIAARALADVERAARAAAARPLAYAWVGAVEPSLETAPQAYRRVLAWNRRIRLFYRVDEASNRIIIIYVRGAGQRTVGLRQLLTPSAE
jgi:plasmid stabilization system protein ParE